MFVVKYINKSDDTRRDTERLAQLKSQVELPERDALSIGIVDALELTDIRLRQGVLDVVQHLVSDELRYVRTLETPAKSLAAFYEAIDVKVQEYGEYLVDLVASVLDQVPTPDRDVGVLYIDVPLISLLRDGQKLVQDLVERVVERSFEGEEFNLGAKCADRVVRSMCQVSSMTRQDAEQKPNRVKWPKQVDKPAEALVEAYLGDTALKDLLLLPVPLCITDNVRMAHTCVTAGSGHGKTQLLQYMIAADLNRPVGQDVGMVIIDSQGDFIKNISRLRTFAGNDRLLIVDASDFDYPVGLNLFDLGGVDLKKMSPRAREQAMTSTVALYSYVIGGLFGSELTSKQEVVFRPVTRLMLTIPNATIDTLRQCLEEPRDFVKYMEKLPGHARHFFLTEFMDKQFTETRKQILRRLYGVLDSATFANMFTARENRLDLSQALNAGRVVVVNTSREFLGDHCSVMGRFIIAMTVKAAFDRASMPVHQRRTSFLYIDEASDYFDENIAKLLEQVRKYKLGVILAHQDLNQLGDSLRASVMANTAVKLAGGGSGRDARYLEDDLKTTSEFILNQHKDRQSTRFATYVRNVTHRAVSWRIPFGVMEGMPVMSEDEFDAVLARNRDELSVGEVTHDEAYVEEEDTRFDDLFSDDDFGDFSEPF